ncbi:GldM-like protein [Nonlabens dokdonensis]|jgi:hypothetical protein|uniref:Gliding motility-associated protein GldM N-terminal domain-containing protein n=3 Tax=Nonlabens dokdonensis TaxID=328515 RepID=L7W750_NONDD|nr:uncharacterized protein DDD_0494 [Nonlabens dokdonensis DSW-6]PZX43313.1 GldM-like protein [Nonlabens dokdonensis]
MVSLISCKQNSGSILETFETLSAPEEAYEIDTTSKNQELLLLVQDSAMENPDKFAGAFNQSVDFHDKTTALTAQINEVKDVIYDFIGETENFSNKNKTADSLLFNGDQLSETGLILKTAMNNYKVSTGDQLYFYPEAEKAAKQIINTKINKEEPDDNLDSFVYRFKGLPSIEVLTELSLMQQQVLKVETLFLEALLKNPLE